MSEMFPDKFTSIDRTVVGEASTAIAVLNGRSATIGQLFLGFRAAAPSSTYQSFVTALTFLYAAGVIEFDGTMVRAA